MTTQGCKQFDELCALVAAGATTQEEESALKNHLLQGCAACERVLPELREAAARLAETLPPVEPPPTVRTQLLDAISRELEITPDKEARPSPAGRRFPWLGASGWALAGGLAVVLLWATDIQQEEVMRRESEIQSMRQILAEKEETLQILEARETQFSQLVGLAPSPSAFGKVFWNPNANAGLLFTFGLPPLPSGKVYQLWAIQGKTPIDAGIFSPDREGRGPFKVKSLPNPRQAVQLFAITIEPSGGSPQPTGEMYLKGTPASF
jgi:hypothetical protein